MVAAWAAYDWNDRKDGRHQGFGFRCDLPNDLWNVQSVYAYYGEALDPALGYMMRPAIQTGFLSVAYQPRPQAGGFPASPMKPACWPSRPGRRTDVFFTTAMRPVPGPTWPG